VQTGRRRAVPWVLGGAGVLAIGATTAGILAVVADGRATELRAEIALGNAPPSTGEAFDSEVQRRDDYKTTAIVLGGSAIVAGAVGFALYFFDSPSSESIKLAPVAAPGIAGVSATGRF